MRGGKASARPGLYGPGKHLLTDSLWLSTIVMIRVFQSMVIAILVVAGGHLSQRNERILDSAEMLIVDLQSGYLKADAKVAQARTVQVKGTVPSRMTKSQIPERGTVLITLP